MNRFFIPLVVFLFLIIEGTLFQFIMPMNDFIAVPRFLIVLFIFLGIHFGRTYSVTYGIIFGLMYDIVYTQLLGVYAFGFAFLSYVFVMTHKRVQDSVLIQLAFVVVALLFFEFYQYGLYRLIGLTTLSMESFLQVRLLPTTVINIAYAIIIYYPFKVLLTYVEKEARLRARI